MKRHLLAIKAVELDCIQDHLTLVRLLWACGIRFSYNEAIMQEHDCRVVAALMDSIKYDEDPNVKWIRTALWAGKLACRQTRHIFSSAKRSYSELTLIPVGGASPIFSEDAKLRSHVAEVTLSTSRDSQFHCLVKFAEVPTDPGTQAARVELIHELYRRGKAGRTLREPPTPEGIQTEPCPAPHRKRVGDSWVTLWKNWENYLE